MHKKGAKTKSYVHNTQQKYDDSQLQWLNYCNQFSNRTK